MAKAIRIHKVGGPEALTVESVDVPAPGPGEIQIRHKAIGLNYIDVYHRAGLYPLPLPATPGIEGSGVVEAIGPDVSEFKVGQRVAYGVAPPGAYAEVRNAPAARMIALPDGIDDRTAAAMMLKGITAEYLIRRCRPVAKGETILLYAAAGGVGQILSQWAKHLGATVIGVVSTEEKAEQAKSNGCAHTIVAKGTPVSKQVMELTNGNGVAAVYDSVGKDTIEDSIACLGRCGMLVNFGYASGFPGPLDTGKLMPKGLYFTRPTVAAYTATREELVGAAKALFDVVLGGAVKINITGTYPLAEAGRAHRDLEGRKTTGSSILLP